MTKNRIVTAFDRYPEQTAQLKKLGDLFGKTGRIQLGQVDVSEIDRIQIDHGLEFIATSTRGSSSRKRLPDAAAGRCFVLWVLSLEATMSCITMIKSWPLIGSAHTVAMRILLFKRSSKCHSA